MNPPIPKSVCEEEMQNAHLDTNVSYYRIYDQCPW